MKMNVTVGMILTLALFASCQGNKSVKTSSVANSQVNVAQNYAPDYLVSRNPAQAAEGISFVMRAIRSVERSSEAEKAIFGLIKSNPGAYGLPATLNFSEIGSLDKLLAMDEASVARKVLMRDMRNGKLDKMKLGKFEVGSFRFKNAFESAYQRYGTAYINEVTKTPKVVANLDYTKLPKTGFGAEADMALIRVEGETQRQIASVALEMSKVTDKADAAAMAVGKEIILNESILGSKGLRLVDGKCAGNLSLPAQRNLVKIGDEMVDVSLAKGGSNVEVFDEAYVNTLYGKNLPSEVAEEGHLKAKTAREELACKKGPRGEVKTCGGTLAPALCTL